MTEAFSAGVTFKGYPFPVETKQELFPHPWHKVKFVLGAGWTLPGAVHAHHPVCGVVIVICVVSGPDVKL